MDQVKVGEICNQVIGKECTSTRIIQPKDCRAGLAGLMGSEAVLSWAELSKCYQPVFDLLFAAKNYAGRSFFYNFIAFIFAVPAFIYVVSVVAGWASCEIANKEDSKKILNEGGVKFTVFGNGDTSSERTKNETIPLNVNLENKTSASAYKKV